MESRTFLAITVLCTFILIDFTCAKPSPHRSNSRKIGDLQDLSTGNSTSSERVELTDYAIPHLNGTSSLPPTVILPRRKFKKHRNKHKRLGHHHNHHKRKHGHRSRDKKIHLDKDDHKEEPEFPAMLQTAGILNNSTHIFPKTDSNGHHKIKRHHRRFHHHNAHKRLHNRRRRLRPHKQTSQEAKEE